MIAVRSIRWIGGLVGLVALVLGLAYWLFQINLINFHMLAGLIVTLSLLILGIIGVCTRGLRVLGIVGILYAPILPIFGMTQSALLIGDLHWLIQIAHMLVGIGALAVISILAMRYQRLKGGTRKNAPTPATSIERG